MSLLAAAVLAACLMVGGVAPAEEPTGWSYDLWSELMSPFCPGRTLADCPSPQADQLRMWILSQEAAGRSEDDVRVQLLERFGDDIRPAPVARGVGLAAYLVPAALLVVGGAVLVWFLRRQTRGRAADRPAPVAPDPELERAIDDELAR